MLGCPHVLDELDITSQLLSNFTFSVYIGYSKFVLLETLESIDALRETCLQSSPASGSFPMSWLFEAGGQSIRASATASVLPMTLAVYLISPSLFLYL